MRTKKMSVEKRPIQSIHSRCRALNAAIREGCIVKANIQGTMQTLISIKSESDGVSLLFQSDAGLAMLMVKPDAVLEFTVLVPRKSEVQA